MTFLLVTLCYTRTRRKWRTSVIILSCDESYNVCSIVQICIFVGNSKTHGIKRGIPTSSFSLLGGGDEGR